jgi:hypothetical protein
MGNAMWLAGLIAVGIGIWGYKAQKDSITKAVSMMSMMTGGKPQGFALKLKGLVDPVDRTKQFGQGMLIAGIILLIVGASFIRGCV